MGKKTARTYTAEFKRQAMELANEIGASRAARQLGIADGNIHNWRARMRDQKTVQPKKVQVTLEEEVRRLRAENAEQKKVIHILKAAAAFFSKDHLK